jgi:hypothetical protein
MATIDQLMAAFGAFGQAAQEYGATKGIQDATLAVQELKKNTEMDYQQRIAAQGQIANQLQAGLAGLNAPQAQIAAAVGAVAPPKIESAADALRLAQTATNPADKEQLLTLATKFGTAESKLKEEMNQPLINQETAALRQREMDKRFAEAYYREGKTAPMPTSEVQKAMDIDFAKSLPKLQAELRTDQDSLVKLDSAVEYLSKGKSSGITLNRGIIGRAVGSERVKAIDNIKQSILPNIKKYFPGSTSNVELLETLASSGLNEGLTDKELARNAQGIQAMIRSGMEAEQRRIEYFRQNKTLDGYNDPRDPANMTAEQVKEMYQQFIDKSSSMRVDKASQSKISAAEAWLNDPANAKSPQRNAVIRKLSTMKNGE